MENVKLFFKGVHKGQKLFGETIAVLINTILLSIVYIVGVGGTSIVARLFKKRFLEKEINSKKDSYWQDFNLTVKKTEDYYKQF